MEIKVIDINVNIGDFHNKGGLIIEEGEVRTTILLSSEEMEILAQELIYKLKEWHVAKEKRHTALERALNQSKGGSE